MASRILKVGLVQSSCGSDHAVNLNKALGGIREAASRGAQLVCLQELFGSTYFCQREDADLCDLAEPVDGPTAQAVRAVAREVGVGVVAPFFERRAPGLYHNSSLLIDARGECVGHYRKMHIPDDPLYYEKFYFAPGDLGFRAFDLPEARVGMLICWDQWYPEAARLTALAGAELLFYPTAIGWHPKERHTEGEAQLQAWQTIQRSHAIANGVFVVAVNRVGHERVGVDDDGIEFWGHSFVCDPTGRVLASAGQQETVLVVDCDLARQEEARRGWPFFRDRRIDAYAGLTARWLHDAS